MTLYAPSEGGDDILDLLFAGEEEQHQQQLDGLPGQVGWLQSAEPSYATPGHCQLYFGLCSIGARTWGRDCTTYAGWPSGSRGSGHLDPRQQRAA